MMFRFENIGFLILLLLIPVAAFLYSYLQKRQKKEWDQFAKNEYWEKFVYGSKPFLGWKPFFLFASVTFLGIIALSNPQWNNSEQEVEIESTDVFIAMDISRSMLADDLKPNRLTRAKNLAQQIVEALEGNRIGLILFAGEAYIFMPLTDDIRSAISFIQAANTEMAPTQGTAIAAAMDLAMNSFDEGNDSGKSIIILSDGEDHEAEINRAISRAKEEQVLAFTVAVGTEEGAYLPGISNDNYLFDEQGKPVKSIVNTAMLEDISKKTGASSFNLSKERNIDQAILKNIAQMETQVTEMVKFAAYDSKFQYLLFPLILILSWQLIRPAISFLNKEVKDEQTY